MDMSLTAWRTADALFVFAMWSVMMVVMMAPSAMPVVLAYSRVQAGRGTSSSGVRAFGFAAGHITVWIAFSAGATLLQWLLHRSATLSMDMAITSSRVAGVVLIAVGIYQLTPAKAACLIKCRSPFDFLVTRWRNGTSGAFVMGLEYGIVCVGCCWALMLVLFVVGVMNLSWIVILTVLILLEKLSGGGVLIARVTGIAITLAGLVSLVR